jgi:hypothetical protein|tara:strand:+ start:1417 stop:1605 length:189 start_codon:yes stop_codon:yes gene_type:complete
MISPIIKLIFILLAIFLGVMMAFFIFTKDKKYLVLAKTALSYLITLGIIIAGIFFTLRYFHL